MLETIREFAAERLAASDRDELLRALLDSMLDLAEAAGLYEEGGVQRPELVNPERANIEIALEWALETGEIALGLRLLWLLELQLSTGDPLGAQRWIDAFLSRAGDDVDSGLLGRVYRVRGATFDMTGRSDLAEQEYARARDLLSEAGDDEAAAHLFNRIAMTALQQGDVDRAARLGAEALELDRRRGHRRDEAIALNVLGSVAFARGELEEGKRLIYRSAELAEEVGFHWWCGITLGNLADRLLDAGELDEPFMLATAAWLAAARGDVYRAGMFWGAVERAEEQRPTPGWTAQRDYYHERVGVAGGPDFERGRAQGRALSYPEAMAAIGATVD
jgi:tetratricopeptide (TPR) repeat protein